MSEEKKQKYDNFLNTEFSVFDIETSGLNPTGDDILEIAAIKFKGKEEIGRFESLIQPTRAVSPEVEKIHGLNEIYLLVNGRSTKLVMEEFMGFIGQSIVVGHNIKEFDWLFVLSQIRRWGLAVPQNKLIDTLELSRQLLKLPRYNLGEVAKSFGFEIVNAHRAMADVEGNAKVFLQLMDIMLNPDYREPPRI